MMEKIEQANKNYIGYEYKEITVLTNKVSFYLDCYENLGWIFNETTSQIHEHSSVSTLHFKRNRNIMNKQELTRLHYQLDDCMNQIDSLEHSKTTKATIYALVTGFIGIFFLTSSIFAITAQPPILWLGILLGIPGLIGIILPIFIFRYWVAKRSETVSILMEEKMNEIYNVCEKGSHLISIS